MNPRTHPYRFIPAYAGNTFARVALSGSSPVHPRVCGEHQTNTTRRSPVNGSSPRMRGTPTINALAIPLARFIPAYAGNTGMFKAVEVSMTVHPRVCGEHEAERTILNKFPGSSPRMRGTRGDCQNGDANQRFIPAYAGNTPFCRVQQYGWPVHPRVCGEHLNSPAFISWGSGSSPRMRGTRSEMRSRGCAGRFIPAYAGNTPRRDCAMVRLAVHPRVCGEHLEQPLVNCRTRGSSPRMRGTQLA